MKSKIFGFFAATIIAAVPVLSNAADEIVSEKIGVVDIQKIMRDSLAAQGLHTQIEKKKQEFENEISKQEEELQKSDKDLAEQRNVLSAEALEKKRGEFKKRIMGVQRNMQTRKAQLENAYNKAISEIQASVLKITADVAKEKNMALVIPTSQILYAQDKMSISDEVLKRLDKELPKVNVTIDKNIDANKAADKPEASDKAASPAKKEEKPRK